MLAPPPVPAARLNGWRLTEDATETPYDGVVTVTARTRVYEDAALRARVRDATGADFAVRFFLASRVRVSPPAAPAALLRRLVARESADAFASRLRDAGVRDVRERDAGAEGVGRGRDVAAEYAGTYPVGDAALDVAARVGVGAVGREFVVTGGAFPTGVRGDGETAATLSGLLSPSTHREELATLMRETE